MKIFLIFFLMFCICVQTASAHLENVHQYILLQSYLYLKLKTGKVIPEMEEQLATWKLNGVYVEAWNKKQELPKYNGGTTRYWELSPALSISIFREDIQDAVWRRSGFANSLVSTTHFWVADSGDDVVSSLIQGPALASTISDSRKAWGNAWEKSRIYAFGKTKLPNIWDGYITIQGNYEERRFGVGNEEQYISYNSMVDLYKTGNYWFHGAKSFNFFPSFGVIASWSTSTFNPPLYNDGGPLSQQVRKLYAYNILGRIAHLLTDMSVPAHVHGDIHACPLGDMDSYEQYMGDKMKLRTGEDCYEDYLNAFYATRWTAQTAANQGNFIFTENEIRSGIYSDEAILRELFYTTNQLTDLFASHKYTPSYSDSPGSYTQQINGNRSLPNGNGIKTNLLSIYSQYSTTVPDVYPSTDITEDNYFQMRGDLLMNYAIRATATLLYWFAIRAEVPMVDVATANPLAVSIDGDDELRGGQCASYSAILSGTGSGLPSTYAWEMRNRDASGLYSRWTAIGTDRDIQVCMPSAARDMQLRVTATNSAGTATNTTTVRRFISTRDGGNVPLAAVNKSSENNISSLSNQKTAGEQSVIMNSAVYGSEIKVESPVTIVTDNLNFNYALPRTSAVKVEIFNSKYKRLATVENAVQNNGSYSYNFNASSLTDGAYFVRVAATEVESEFLQRSFLPFYVRRTGRR